LTAYFGYSQSSTAGLVVAKQGNQSTTVLNKTRGHMSGR